MSYNKWLYAYANPILIKDPTGLMPSCAGIPDCGVDGWNPPPRTPSAQPPRTTTPPVITQPSPAPGYQDPAAGDVGLPVGPPTSSPPSGAPVATQPAPGNNPVTNPVGSGLMQHCGPNNLEDCGGVDAFAPTTSTGGSHGLNALSRSSTANQGQPCQITIGFPPYAITLPCPHWFQSWLSSSGTATATPRPSASSLLRPIPPRSHV